MASMGSTWLFPPPAAPPLIPKTGPILGSRKVHVAFCPIRFSACVNPMVVTVLPSPKGVGLTLVIST